LAPGQMRQARGPGTGRASTARHSS